MFRLVPPTLLLVLVCACSEESSPVPPSLPSVGVLELPISLRTADRVSEAAHIEVSPSEIRLEGQRVIGLERGRVAAGDLEAGVIRPLKAAFARGAARRAIAVRMHVATPHGTLVVLLATARSAGVQKAGFEVRRPGSQPQTGWLVLDNFRVEAQSETPPSFEGEPQRTWDEFSAAWPDASEGCRRGHVVNCALPPDAPVTGGQAQIVLFARGNAVSIELHRFGAPLPVAAAPLPLLAGVRAQAAAEPAPEPTTDATFMWRDAAATDELSPVAGTMRPLCGAKPCGASVVADAGTMGGKLLSLIGAAFPDGTPSPALVFIAPR